MSLYADARYERADAMSRRLWGGHGGPGVERLVAALSVWVAAGGRLGRGGSAGAEPAR
ncbi:hypothetical protein FRAHR75_270082 [Frankia sp. Hr75.2]|nr:hypothetical protein FRAHR75_270082 [Frankia sp. Hr75.2]